MKPYYEHAGITIYHGDCREVLPTLTEKVDLVLTDPPYGINLGVAERSGKMMKHGNSSYTLFDDTPDYVQRTVVPVIEECIGLATRVAVTSGIRNMFLYPNPTTVWVLHWPNGAGLGRWSAFNCWQPVLLYGDGPKRVGSIPDTFTTTEQAERNGHPCPKPLRLWSKLLAAVSCEGELILDPFMGSGTTLRAAKDLGRRAIGIEIEERYCEIAAKRLAQEVLL